MESTSAMLATTKYITEPLVATGRYFSRARVIFSSVISASFSRVLITPEVTWGEKTNGMLGHQIKEKFLKRQATYQSAIYKHERGNEA